MVSRPTENAHADGKGVVVNRVELEPPQIVIEVRAPSATRVLQIGGQEGGSQRYYAPVSEEGRGDVSLLGEKDAARIVRDLAAFAGTGAPK